MMIAPISPVSATAMVLPPRLQPSVPAAEATPAPKGTPKAIPEAAFPPTIGPKAPQKTECQTCKQRRYQDQSNDPGVSFKTPTALTPSEAAVLVPQHEGEHVARETLDAESKGERVMTTVVLHVETCPECGRLYLAGGTTHITRWKKEPQEAQTPASK